MTDSTPSLETKSSSDLHHALDDLLRAFETYIVAGLVYLALSFVVRAAFSLFGQAAFTRRRKLGTAL